MSNQLNPRFNSQYVAYQSVLGYHQYPLNYSHLQYQGSEGIPSDTYTSKPRHNKEPKSTQYKQPSAHTVTTTANTIRTAALTTDVVQQSQIYNFTDDDYNMEIIEDLLESQNVNTTENPFNFEEYIVDDNDLMMGEIELEEEKEKECLIKKQESEIRFKDYYTFIDYAMQEDKEDIAEVEKSVRQLELSLVQRLKYYNITIKMKKRIFKLSIDYQMIETLLKDVKKIIQIRCAHNNNATSTHTTNNTLQ